MPPRSFMLSCGTGDGDDADRDHPTPLAALNAAHGRALSWTSKAGMLVQRPDNTHQPQAT
jgi:hypothetical protein